MRSGSTIGPMPDRPKRKNPPMLVGEETLGERMARYRKEKRLTQTALAEAMGTIQPLISDYERDRLRPNAEVIVAFATVLDISTDELLGLKQTRKRPGPKSRLDAKIEQVRSLPRRDQEVVLRMLDGLLNAKSAET